MNNRTQVELSYDKNQRNALLGDGTSSECTNNSQGSEQKLKEDDSTLDSQKKKFNVDDPLGLLKSRHIAAAAADASNACNNDKSRKRKYKSEEERLEANRKSAAESRHRKKILLEELQKSICLLREENTRLKLENEMFKQNMNLSQASMLPLGTSVTPSLFKVHNPSPNVLGGNSGMNVVPQNSLLHPAGLIQQNLPYSLGAPTTFPTNLFEGNQIDQIMDRTSLVAVSDLYDPVSFFLQL